MTKKPDTRMQDKGLSKNEQGPEIMASWKQDSGLVRFGLVRDKHLLDQMKITFGNHGPRLKGVSGKGPRVRVQELGSKS